MLSVAFFKLCSSAPGFVWFFCIISVMLLILFMYCFHNFVEFSFCFLVALWASLKQIFLILCQASCRSPSLWDQLLVKYYDSLVVSCFFSVFFSISWSLSVLSLHLKKQTPLVFTDWIREINTFHQSCEGFWGILRPFLWLCYSIFLVSSWKDILKIEFLLSILQSHAMCWWFLISLLFLQLSFVCFPPIPQSWASFLCMCMLTSYLQRLASTSLRGAHREKTMGWGGEWGMQNIGSVHLPTVGDLQARHPQQLMSRFSGRDHHKVNRICIPLVCSILSPGWSPSCPLPTNHSTPHYIGGLRKNRYL